MPEIPDGAKVPEDHKPKAEDAPETVTVTVRGEEFTLSSDHFDDWELLDDIGRADDGDAGRAPMIMRKMLGDQYSKAIEVIRGEDGRVRIEDGKNFLLELMQAANPNS